MAQVPTPKYSGFGFDTGSGKTAIKRPPKILRGSIQRTEAKIVTWIVFGSLLFFALLYVVYRCTEFGCRFW